MKKILLILICSVLLISCNYNNDTIIVKPIENTNEIKITIPNKEILNYTFTLYILDDYKWIRKKSYGYDINFGHKLIIKTSDGARNELYLYDNEGYMLDDLYEDMNLDNCDDFKYTQLLYSNKKLEDDKELPLLAFIYTDDDSDLSLESIDDIDISKKSDYKFGRMITIELR